MNVGKLQNGDEEFLEIFLSGHAAISMFLRGNMRAAGLNYEDQSYYGEYFGSFTEAGDIDGVLARYWNGNIMMQAANERLHPRRENRAATPFRNGCTRWRPQLGEHDTYFVPSGVE